MREAPALPPDAGASRCWSSQSEREGFLPWPERASDWWRRSGGFGADDVLAPLGERGLL
jgi:hypothetical protein